MSSENMGEIATSSAVLWERQDKESSFMWEFLKGVNQKYGKDLKTYEELHQWSIENVGEFWGDVWAFTGMQHDAPYEKMLDPNAPMFPRPNFFQGSTLNFAYSILYPLDAPDPTTAAIINATETTTEEIAWLALRQQVILLATSMHHHGLRPYDRVAGYLGNHHNTVVAMLATTWLGAIWTGISADQGVGAVLDRLVQIEPTMLFGDNAVMHSGKVHESATKTKEILKSLPTLKAIVVFETVPGVVDLNGYEVGMGKAWSYKDFLASASDVPNVSCQMFPPDHPVYILYSSGTTGKPKCIVHSAAGTLIQHKKEHVLHCDIHPGDRMLYITTCSWMMWHWLVSALASSATIILFQGSPFKPHGALTIPRLLSSLKVTHFGTSAAYLAVLEQNNCRPLLENPAIDLSLLKAIYSTGSPLAPSTFRYVYDAFPKTINLGSITGGTDIISLFGAPNPLLPVIEGEIQCRALGMALSAVNPSGTPTSPGLPGDLLCTVPFPSQPIGFYSPPSTFENPEIQKAVHSHGLDSLTLNLSTYSASYFEVFPPFWHHGDFVSLPKSGGMLMLGRSDGVLNPSGVRFGSSEIYNILLAHFPSSVEDALCIGRLRQSLGEKDETVVLFLKMRAGHSCSPELLERIRDVIRRDLSPRHVPGVMVECFEIPKTTNDKKVEVAVKQILCGTDIRISASVANPGCLDWYREWAKMN